MFIGNLLLFQKDITCLSNVHILLTTQSAHLHNFSHFLLTWKLKSSWNKKYNSLIMMYIFLLSLLLFNNEYIIVCCYILCKTSSKCHARRWFRKEHCCTRIILRWRLQLLWKQHACPLKLRQGFRKSKETSEKCYCRPYILWQTLQLPVQVSITVDRSYKNKAQMNR